MRKIIDVGSLTVLIGLSSSLLQGCSPAGGGDWRVCTDAQGRRVPDVQCNTRPGRGGGGSHVGWVYINGGRGAPALGDIARDARTTPESGRSYGLAPAEGIARGGFGRIGGWLGHAGT